MAKGLERFIRQLESATKRVDIMSPDEIAVLLRRAALRLGNADGIVIEPDVAEKFADVAAMAGASRHELGNLIIRDWLVANGHLPAEVDEGT